MKGTEQHSILTYLNTLQSSEQVQEEMAKIFDQYQSFMECQEQRGNEQRFMSGLELSAIQSTPKEFPQKSECQEQNHKNKKGQVEVFHKMIHQLIKENLGFKKQLRDIRQILQDLIIDIQENLAKKIKDFVYFSSLFEEQNALNMAKYLKSTIKNLRQDQKLVDKNGYQVKALEKQNIQLASQNWSLKHFIQVRKLYSQHLKKIIEEKQRSIDKVNSEREKDRQILEKLSIMEMNTDIKYRNRNDLIMMIKNLVCLILRHDKDCKNTQNRISTQGLEKFSIKKKESRQQQMGQLKNQ